MKRNFMLCTCFLLALSVKQADGKSNVQSGVAKTAKKGLRAGLDVAEGLPVVGNAVRSMRKFFPGASSETEMVDLMGEQVETSKSCLEKMQDLSRDMIEMRKSIEEAAAIKKQGERLFKDLSEAKYAKVGVGISEKITNISLNPSDYIPSLDSTKQLKRDCSFSCYREKSLLGNIDAFSKRSTHFLDTKSIKGLNSLCSDIQKELLRSERITIASKEANNRLIPIYQEQIKKLEAQNKQIDKTLSDPRFFKDDPLKYFQLESLKNKNNIRMCELIEKINKLRMASEKVSKEDEAAIGELYSEQLYQELLRHTLEEKKKRNSKFK